MKHICIIYGKPRAAVGHEPSCEREPLHGLRNVNSKRYLPTSDKKPSPYRLYAPHHPPQHLHQPPRKRRLHLRLQPSQPPTLGRRTQHQHHRTNRRRMDRRITNGKSEHPLRPPQQPRRHGSLRYHPIWPGVLQPTPSLPKPRRQRSSIHALPSTRNVRRAIPNRLRLHHNRFSQAQSDTRSEVTCP